LLSKIPKGKVTTYKEVAQKLDSKAYRAVGTVIGKNPNAPEVPCHRVVGSDGSLGGYAFGLDKKIELLKQENIEVRNNKIENFKDKLFKFN
jgi:methylated-DNA-[protein]-cysteine S-methyltransferase